ncbi:MAG: ABC transporter substrate-binding protein, partial [Patescibacteria group bacterium]
MVKKPKKVLINLSEKIKVILLLFLLFITACTSNIENPKGVYNMGVLAPITGAVPTCGEDIIMGTTLALSRLDQMGGVKIVPIVEDTQFKPAVAVSAAQKLL